MKAQLVSSVKSSRITAIAAVLAIIAGSSLPFLVQPLFALAITGAIGLVLAIAVKPQLGPYLYLLLSPLIVGIARGQGGLILRPNEFILVVILLGMSARLWWDLYHGSLFYLQLSRVDVAIALTVVFGSAIPLLLGYGRGTHLNQDDFLYSIVFFKYAMLYFVCRYGIRTGNDLKFCLGLILLSGFMVAIIGALQVLNLWGVSTLLDRYYDAPFEGAAGPSTLRATSTIASSFGLADLMSMCLALSVAQVAKFRGKIRALSLILSFVFLGGCIAAGSFSGVIGCIVILLIVGAYTRQLVHLFMFGVPAFAVATLVFWSTVSSRLSGFSSYRSLPRSWIGRLDNLERFFWPDLFTGWNWLIGVRPAARVAAPETWRQWVYIESGYTWLMWTGGIFLLVAFVYLIWAVFSEFNDRAFEPDSTSSVLAIAAIATSGLLIVLMLFDPHLTVRGSADLYFPLLALSGLDLRRNRVMRPLSAQVR
jgi:ABC-type multidrug transport system fused ATPase/permease subunit